MSMRSHIYLMLLHRVSVQYVRSVLYKDRYHPLCGRCSLPGLFTLYCNTVFAGLPACDIQRLQSVLNSSVRIVTVARKYDHVTSLLQNCHWLPIAERIENKLCTLVYLCLQGNAPRCHADHVALTSSVSWRSGLRSADTHCGSAENLFIVWRQTFISRRPACLEQSLCPVNVLF